MAFITWGVGIASIVIIDVDQKVRTEIRQYLKELSIDDIQEFSSSQEFETRYFVRLITKPKPKEKVAEPIVNISSEIIKILNEAEFNYEQPFSEDSCEIEISLDKGGILKSSAAKLFGKISTELIAKNITFESFIHGEVVKSFKKFTQELIAGNRPQSIILVMLTENKKNWVIELNTRIDGKKTIFLLKNVTTQVAKALGKYSQKDEPKAEKNELKPIDMIIFRYTCVPKLETKKWVSRTATLLKKGDLHLLKLHEKLMHTAFAAA